MHRRRLTVALALALLSSPACEDRSYRDIGAEINLVTQRNDALVPAGIARLAAFGKRAVPQIEIALHTATPAGKLNLLTALEAIGEPESAAILRHFAIYDPQPEVRSACEGVLRRWSTRSTPLAATARAALASIGDKRAHGEGPVVVGDAAPAAKSKQ